MSDTASPLTEAVVPVAALPAVLTPEEAAAYVRLPVKTIRSALRRGELPGALVDRRWWIRRGDLDALFAPWSRPPRPSPEPVRLPARAPALGRPGRPPKRRHRPRADA